MHLKKGLNIATTIVLFNISSMHAVASATGLFFSYAHMKVPNWRKIILSVGAL